MPRLLPWLTDLAIRDMPALLCATRVECLAVPVAELLGVSNVEDVLRHLYGLDGTAHGDEFVLLCPHPRHDDTRPSASVNLTTGLWSCFSCGQAGDLAKLGELALERPREEIVRLLQPSTPEALQQTVRAKLAGLLRPAAHRTTPDTRSYGPYEPGPLSYMRGRGFTRATCERWGVRWCISQTMTGRSGRDFFVRHCVAFPVRDSYQRLLGWGYRATPMSPPGQPRYIYTPGVELSEVWFGSHLFQHERDIVVVEGPLDAMWLDQAGFAAVAMLGSSMTAKAPWLRRYRRVTILADRDSAGIMAARKLGAALGETVPVRIARYQPGADATDPQGMSPVDVEIALEQAVPWAAWRMRLS